MLWSALENTGSKIYLSKQSCVQSYIKPQELFNFIFWTGALKLSICI